MPRIGIRLIPPIYPRQRFLPGRAFVRSDDANKARRLAEVPAPRFVRSGTAKIVSLSRRCEAKQRNDRARDVVRNGGRVVSGSASGFPKRKVVERNERALLRRT